MPRAAWATPAGPSLRKLPRELAVARVEVDGAHTNLHRVLVQIVEEDDLGALELRPSPERLPLVAEGAPDRTLQRQLPVVGVLDGREGPLAGDADHEGHELVGLGGLPAAPRNRRRAGVGVVGHEPTLSPNTPAREA